MNGDVGASAAEWVCVVRRARLGPSVTAVALMVATYADPDGSRAFPGIARLAYQCEVSYSTARRGLRVLRRLGLLEKTRRGNYRRGMSDEYRLVMAEDLLDRVHVPTPEQERKSILEIRERHRSSRSTGEP